MPYYPVQTIWLEWLDAALAANGFVNGKYGDTPYCYKLSDYQPDDGGVAVYADIILGGRKLGRAQVLKNGKVELWLDFAQWFNGQDVMFYTGLIDPTLMLFPNRVRLKE